MIDLDSDDAPLQMQYYHASLMLDLSTGVGRCVPACFAQCCSVHVHSYEFQMVTGGQHEVSARGGQVPLVQAPFLRLTAPALTNLAVGGVRMRVAARGNEAGSLSAGHSDEWWSTAHAHFRVLSGTMPLSSTAAWNAPISAAPSKRITTPSTLRRRMART